MNTSNYYRIVIICTLLSFAIQPVAGQSKLPQKKVVHTFYGLGDFGANTNSNEAQQNLNGLQQKISGATVNTTVLFLGNNASASGYPTDASDSQTLARKNLDAQLHALEGYEGKAIFLPGDEDWKSGSSGLKAQRSYINNALGTGSFLPTKSCPIERVVINDLVDLILVDSYWALMDWNKYPGINHNCHIKTKEEFYVELESDIKKGEGKIVIVATHHPIESYGKFSSRFSFGIDPRDLSNHKYKEFSERLVTMARQVDNVVFLSGHDKNLQYFEEDGIRSIISGSGAISTKVSSTREGFSSSKLGFCKITLYEDGSVWVSFFDSSNDFTDSIFDSEIKRGGADSSRMIDYKEYDTPQFVSASIYSPDELKKSTIFKAIWGAHYRQDYITKIDAKTALLDTLYGGLRPIRKGGGHQTNSLRLVNPEGREYAMRSVKKSALRFIQYFLFKTEYLEPDINETYFVKLLQDYWTTANPYGLLTVGDLSDALGILHPNPKLYYIPKQKALKGYNDAYGDRLYFIEERLSEGQEDVTSLGKSDRIINTSKLLDKLRKKEALKIDEQLYIRTRIFDNLIGDWDRHADQWKWAEYLGQDDTVLYKPIPRDRDQVYSDFDGLVLNALTTLTPPLRFMQRYDKTYNHVKWYNDAGDDVDLAVLKDHTREDWIAEARYIKEHLTKDVIDKAFANIPKEMNQQKLKSIRKAFDGRLARIEENAGDMYDYLAKCVLVIGTDGSDFFEVTRLQDGKTRIQGFHYDTGIKGDAFWDVEYDSAHTSEIWLYGLNDDDTFFINGDGNKRIHIKIIGGHGNDTYKAENPKNIKVYDFKSKKNTFQDKVPKMLSDNADMNTYFFMKHRRDLSRVTPLLGFDPDDGLGFGLQYNYQKNSLVRNPFTDDHHIGLTYYFQTSSVEAFYSGEFANIFDKVNLGLEVDYNSPGYTDNFFGFGNDTPNLDNDLSLDFNRVRIEQFSVKPSLILRGFQGSEILFGVSYEYRAVEETADRFIAQAGLPTMTFEPQNFLGMEFAYRYDNLADDVISKSGIGWGITLGYKSNLDNDRNYAYAIPQARIATKLDKRGILVFASQMKSQLNFGNDFEFYQGATLGDRDGLRGFRQQRFTGKRSFFHSSDLRVSLGRLRNGILPITVGAYGGFDYGRVWFPGNTSNTWHTSYGGGMYFSLAGFSALNLAYFDSSDGGRFTFGLSLPF